MAIPSLLVWGAISYQPHAQLVFVLGTLNSTWYINQPVVVSFFKSVNNGALQQKNACPHTANATQPPLRFVRRLSYPARSPDLPPIEHV